ncbi:MAG: protoheme IX farnesyltransferase [Chloroflexi bacterium]|nr:protoheme IX farnesyltransferase [Chloroflexota bacterium]
MSSRVMVRRRAVWEQIGDHVALTKPRVMSLLLYTALGGMVLAARGLPDIVVLVSVLVGGALASGGASSINHGLEGELDVAMRRTRMRPVAAGRISPRHAIAYGVALNIAAFAVILLGANLLAAGLAMSGTVIYVFVYTLWLKRSTSQNIVIGGAAGAIPPLVGWAAVTGNVALPSWYLFSIIFFWTPPHFWALAIMIKDDYKAAGVPMLPVVVGFRETRRAMFLYTLILTALTALLYVTTEQLGLFYLIGALSLGAAYIYFSARLWWKEGRGPVVTLYKFSLLYLGLLFTLIMVDASLS